MGRRLWCALDGRQRSVQIPMGGGDVGALSSMSDGAMRDGGCYLSIACNGDGEREMSMHRQEANTSYTAHNDHIHIHPTDLRPEAPTRTRADGKEKGTETEEITCSGEEWGVVVRRGERKST